MASSWRYGKRSKYRAKVSQDPEDFYRLDPTKSSAENAYDIYTALCCRDTRDTKLLFLLNGLATLCQQQQQQQTTKNNLGFCTEELLYCLSASLIHTFTQVRAAALRTIRYALATPKDLKIFNSMQLPHLLCRSIDVMLKNDDERVQALKLIRKMLAISPKDISPVLVRCLVSLADSGMEEGDNMLRACLATLCEFAVLNPTLLIVCGGVTSITRNVLECPNPRIAESLCGVLLYLLEWPQTRNISGVRLDCLAAPYCDFTYRLGIMDKNKDARELRYTSCRLALLSVLRSWTGTIEFCDPSKPSGLKAIVDALYLNQVEVRKAILDLLYELLGLPQPAWTDDYAVALQTVDPSDFQDAWLLSNGFVAMEGRCILPSLASRAPNVCEQHVALLLYCFLETGLLNALVEVIVSSDAHLSVHATVLIGKILHLMHTHLPADICSTSPALPTLVAHATRNNQRATAAISALQSYQKMLRNRPASCSLFLDSIIQGGSLIQTRLFRREINAQEQPLSGSLQIPPIGGPLQMTGMLDRPRLDSVSSSDESMSQSSSSRRSSFRLKRKLLPFLENLRVNRLIKDSNVLLLPDSSAWDWEVVIAILRSNLIRKTDDTSGKFLKRLVNYFKPSNNRFSHQDLTHGRGVPPFVIAGLDLIDWLLASKELESMRLLTDFFSDVSQHLLAVSTSNRAHDCLFSPQHMNNTMCQQYFLFIGRMCRVQKGISILTNTAVFEHLINLVRNTDHVCYVKLIVSGLDYTIDSVTRKVLDRALTASKTRSGRLYATQFLVVLLRARIPHFEVWGIPLVIQQTKDPDRSVVLAAMDVLEEASHEKYYLEEIVSLWPNLKSLGDVGRLLMSRYYSLSRGLNHGKARIKEEIDYWKNGYNKRYVLLVEADTHASLTLHVRNEDGYYSRRDCITRPIVIPPNISPHLYGQMVQTAQGTTALLKHGDLPNLIEIIGRGECTDDAECLTLKAALWAVGHASTHSNGIEYFQEAGSRIYEKIVLLATKCDVYSIRSTCYNILGLIGGTYAGANILFKLNWLSVRHDRNTIWPVHQPEDWMSSNYTPVRHQYEDIISPYNYPGFEDQIDGSYYTGSYWNLLLSSNTTTTKEGGAATTSSEPQDANTTTESSKATDELATKQTLAANTAAKSKTLPESSYPRQNKHQRSISESKTTDVISLIGGMHHQHRTRYSSCTDSNTSGVSSCESVTGRTAAAMGDYQQFPLSPIPSMSNLLEILPQPSLLRRTSLLGTSYLQNAISPVDMKGYAHLRSLRRHCRPVLSESATDLYDIIDRSELVAYPPFRTRKTSFGESQRGLKVRSLDRQTSLRMLTQLDSEELQVPLPTLAVPKFLSQNDSQGPTYAGICVPKNLLDLFPTRNMARTYVSRDIQDQDLMDVYLLTAKQQLLNDSLNNEGGDESSVISSLSDVSSVSKRSKWLGTNKHGHSNCLHCSRTRRTRTHTQRLESELAMASELYTNASATLSTAGVAALSRKSNAKQQSTQSASTIQLSDISFNSPESILSEESMPDRLTANILHNVQRLANPVSAKQSKLSLLELKQKHSSAFQDICLFSEICKTLGRCSYRMSARRFLQELFLDLNFDSFYAEPLEILAKREREWIAAGGTSNTAGVIGIEKRLADLTFSAAGDSEQTIRLHQQQQAAHTTGASHRSSNITTATTAGVGTAGVSNANITYAQVTVHKSHQKSQPLASVYETSCENLLLEQSPRLQVHVTKTELDAGNQHERINGKNASIAATTTSLTATTTTTTTTTALRTSPSSTTKSGSFNVAPPPAAPPPPQRDEIHNELRITTDDEEDELSSSRLDYDEVDSKLKRCSTIPSASYLTGFRNANTPSSSSSSNSKDQTRYNNRISLQPAKSYATNTALPSPALTVASIENENKTYTRGRCYTLELDLSCTKNKFPITDRCSVSGTGVSKHNQPANATTTTTTSSPTEPIVHATIAPTSLTSTTSLSRQISFGYFNHKSAEQQQRKSYTATGGAPFHATIATAVTSALPTTTTTTTTTLSLNCCEASTTSPLSTSSLTITKSLAASLAKPIGSLYCEKRLQSSKSEAVLTNMRTSTTGNGGGGGDGGDGMRTSTVTTPAFLPTRPVGGVSSTTTTSALSSAAASTTVTTVTTSKKS